MFYAVKKLHTASLMISMASLRPTSLWRSHQLANLENRKHDPYFEASL